LLPFHYLYFPEPEYSFQRLFEQKSFGGQPENGEHAVIGAELPCFKDDAIWCAAEEAVLKKVVSGLERAQLVSGNDVAASAIARESHAYPMYTWNYRGGLETILDEVGRIQNLLPNGRQSLFKLNNVHHCVEMGLAAAEHIARERPPVSWQASLREFKNFRVSDC
jgi:protoporphyrinogen oxidase